MRRLIIQLVMGIPAVSLPISKKITKYLSTHLSFFDINCKCLSQVNLYSNVGLKFKLFLIFVTFFLHWAFSLKSILFASYVIPTRFPHFFLFKIARVMFTIIFKFLWGILFWPYPKMKYSRDENSEYFSLIIYWGRPETV